MIQEQLITIFIPVYNGEKYLLKTLTSIKQQTYTNIEILLVDDSSTDSSRVILEKFVNEDGRFKFFSKKNGGMAPCSWNFIIPEIKGSFLFYSSQDDLFSNDLIEKMVIRQIQTNADAIIPDMEYYFENSNKNKRIIGLNGDRDIVLNGRQACIESLNWNIHGFAMMNKKLFLNQFFPEDAFDSDEFITRKLFFESNKVAFCQGVFFYRQDNLEAITKTFSMKNFYTLNTLFRLFIFLKENNFDNKHVLNIQLLLLQTHIHLAAKFEVYNFNTIFDKKEIQLFLFNFRKKLIKNPFYFSITSYAITKFNFKLIILLIICKVAILFKFTKMIYIKKYKSLIY